MVNPRSFPHHLASNHYDVAEGPHGIVSRVPPQHTVDVRFRLDRAFVDAFRHEKPPFGFNGLGEVVYLRTYARAKENGETELWVDTVERVVEGAFEILQHYVVNKLQCTWDEDEVVLRSPSPLKCCASCRFVV